MKPVHFYLLFIPSLFIAFHSLFAEVAKIEPNEISFVIENQLKALRSNDIKAAYKNFTTVNFQKNSSFEEYQKLVKSIQPLNSNKLFKYDSFYVEEGIATFSGELVATNGSTVRVEFDVVKEGDSWKINGMQLFQFEETLSPR